MTQEIREIQRDIPFPVNGDGGGVGALSFRVLQWIGSTGSHAPAYWSTARDTWLRNFYLNSDYLKIAVSTFTQKAYGVPLVIAPRDRTVKAHTVLANEIRGDLMRNSGMLKGFFSEFSKFTADYLTTDNGGFLLVMGPGKADGAITGQVSGVVHLDSARCTRTGDPVYPVVYDHTNGSRYKLHYTRVIFMSSMPSSDALLFDVGLCAVSRCIDAAHDMMDIIHYTSEKLGSRPARQIVYAKRGITMAMLEKAILHAQSKLDAQGLEHFARTLLLAPAQGQELELDLLDLAKTPDGFDRMQSTILDLAVIAASFGLDMRDLAHSFGVAGQTKADAEVMHMKTNDKGVQRFLSDFSEQLSQKVLPETIEAYFDYVSDTQDEQDATIRKLRAEGRQIDLTNGSITIRVARELMLENQEITEQQFEDMELADGRLADGMDVLMLFQSQDSEIRRILDLGIDDTIAATVDDAIINERIRLAWERHDAAPNANIKRKMRQAIAALNKLRTQQTPTPNEPRTEPAQPDEQSAEDEDEPEAVKSLHTKQDEILDGMMAEYQSDLDRLTERAIDGDIDQESFEEEMAAIVAALLLAAFLRGSGRSENDLTAELRRRIDAEIRVNLAAVSGYANDIYAGRYGHDRLGVDGAERRNTLWVGMLAGMFALGQTRVRDAEQVYYRWQVGDTEHCPDCLRLNGQVHTAEEWARSGWHPRGGNLQCGGFRCQCAYIQTSGPSRGGF